MTSWSHVSGLVQRTAVFFIVAMLLTAGIGTAEAQTIVEVDGPDRGETTYMTRSSLQMNGGDVLVRPIGVSGPEGSEWALMLIGTDAETVTFMANGTPVQVKNVEVSDGSGPLSVHVSKQAFLMLAEAGTTRLTISGTTHQLPEDVQAAMKKIYERAL